jgi:reverse gyrase
MQVFPYPLDAFQRKALEKFLGGKSVVVCAPTGAGKTAIAEAAAAAVLARGQRVIYTTPLKVPDADATAVDRHLHSSAQSSQMPCSVVDAVSASTSWSCLCLHAAAHVLLP